MRGKAAIVTGAAQGIGRGIASVLVQNGARVLLCDKNEEGVRETAQEIGAGETGKAVPLRVDVRNRHDIEGAVKVALKSFGVIDILVNNAGIQKLDLMVDMDEQAWDEVFSVNVKGAFLFSKAVAPHMMERRSGKIINVSSDSGLIPFERECAYGASKAALIAFTRILALELGHYGICCNALCPGATDTPLLRMNYGKDEAALKKFTESTALKKIPVPEDIGKVVLFLASSLSDHVTGERIVVSGFEPMRL